MLSLIPSVIDFIYIEAAAAPTILLFLLLFISLLSVLAIPTTDYRQPNILTSETFLEEY